MFGNTKGWIISGILVLLTAGLVFLGSQAPKPTPPSGNLAIARKSAVLPMDPKSLVLPGPKDADAGEELRAIAESVKAKSQAFDKFDNAKTDKAVRLVATPVEDEVKALVKATQNARLTGLLRLDQAVAYGDKPYLTNLRRLGGAANRLGWAYNTTDPKDPKKARQYLEAAFQLGRMIFDDRIIFKQWRDGTDLMYNSSFYLGALIGKTDPKAKDAFTSFRDKIDTIGKPARETWMTIYHTNQAQYPGDVMDIAANSPDPMWRTEAVLKVGRMRLMDGVSYPDQLACKDLLDKLAADTTLPAQVKLAVDIALKLNPTTFQDVDREP